MGVAPPSPCMPLKRHYRDLLNNQLSRNMKNGLAENNHGPGRTRTGDHLHVKEIS
jgi:hypothetical protein